MTATITACDERDRQDGGERTSADMGERGAYAARGGCGIVGVHERIRPKQHERDDAGDGEADGGEQHRSRQVGDADARRRTHAPGPVRLGPMTAPTVVDHTTSESARPICRGSARSTAANRDCRLAAVLAPNRTSPSSTIGRRSALAPTRSRRRADGAAQPAEGQGGPPTGSRRDRGQRDRERGRSDGEHHDGHTGPAGGAADVLDQQRADGEARAVADATDDLDERQNRDDPR